MVLAHDRAPDVDLELVSPFYTPAEVADLARVSSRTVLNWIKNGQLAAVRISDRTIRVPRRSILRLLAPATLTAPKEVAFDEIRIDAD
jgi:excisionase family DNA binding protein